MTRREQLEALLQQEPHDVFLHYALACELIKQGDCAGGCARFQKLHQDFPDYVPAWFKHAQVLAELGDLTQAREVGQRGLETANRVGDRHAAGEIAAFLELLPDT